MYNRVPENEIKNYGKPPNCPERIWIQAVENNPDASRYITLLFYFI